MANRLEIAADVVINGANQIPVVSNDLEKLNQAGQNAGNALGGKTTAGKPGLTAGANNATMSLINMNRVVQDAPFGLLGIANNIDPLLQSLTALGNQAAPAGASGLTKFKAAGSALLTTFMGPQGILFAISAATSLMLVFGKDLFKSSDALDVATKSANAYADALLRISKEEAKLSEDTELGRLQRERETLQARIQSGTTRGQATSFLGRALTGGATITTESGEVPALKTRVAELDAQILALQKLQNDALTQNIEGLKQIEQFRKNELELLKQRAEADPILGDELISLEDEEIQAVLIEIEQENFKRMEEDSRKELKLTQETAEQKLEIHRQYQEQRRALEQQIFDSQLSITQDSLTAIQQLYIAFGGQNKEIQAGFILATKIVSIAQIISDGIAKSAAATAQGLALAANPLTAGLSAQAFTSAALIKASTAAAVVAVGATAAAQIAQLYSGGGGSSSSSIAQIGSGQTITAGYTGFSASANPASAQQERRGTNQNAPTGNTVQRLIIADGFGNMVARGQLEISANPNLRPSF